MEEITPSYFQCPECDKYRITVHWLVPDTSLLDMMIHFIQAHQKMCPLALLDELKLIPGPVSNGA